MSEQRFYNLQGEPIDHEEWVRLFDAEHRVVSTTVERIAIDTLYLGSDFGSGTKPILFETQVSYGVNVDYQEYWPTREAALAGHDRMVARIRNGERPRGSET